MPTSTYVVDFTESHEPKLNILSCCVYSRYKRRQVLVTTRQKIIACVSDIRRVTPRDAVSTCLLNYQD